MSADSFEFGIVQNLSFWKRLSSSTNKLMGKSNTVVSAFTLYWHLQQYYLHPLKCKFQREDVARDEILAFFASHITAINNIYGSTVFETYTNDLDFSGVQFRVQNTKVSLGHAFVNL